MARTTGRSFTRLCNEVRLKTGLPQNSNELYLNSLGLLKTELDNDINLRFVDFCERHNISYRGMANWLAINNMDFFLHTGANMCSQRHRGSQRQQTALYSAPFQRGQGTSKIRKDTGYIPERAGFQSTLFVESSLRQNGNKLL